MRSTLRRVMPLILGLLFLAWGANANVALKNGNFFVGYTDVFYSGGFEPKIERIYNSKTPYNGMFGQGWGNEYEVFLGVPGDGSLVVYEYGGGAENRFYANDPKVLDVAGAVEDLIKAAHQANEITNTDAEEIYRRKLTDDAVFRGDEWIKYQKQLLVTPHEVPMGTEFFSNRFSYQIITRVTEGYQRLSDNGYTELFNTRGQLIRVTDRNNNFIDLAYNQAGRLSRITDNYGRTIGLVFNPRGKVERLVNSDGTFALYRYDDRDRLVYSVDVSGNVYEYSYDDHHNMTRIFYSDKTTMEMTYHSSELFENIHTVKDPDNIKTEYLYEFDKNVKGQTWMAVRKRDPKGKMISNDTYEYFSRINSAGDEWTEAMITTIKGKRTETHYREGNGMPLRIISNGEEVGFEYDDQGRVIRKETSTKVTEVQYDSRFSKVILVQNYAKKSPQKITWSKFEYDQTGNMILATNSANKSVRLAYDSTGRAIELIGGDKNRIQFEYDKDSRITLIRLIKPNGTTASMIVSEKDVAPKDDNEDSPWHRKTSALEIMGSEVARVQAQAKRGHPVAKAATEACQSLVEIIKPAGVSLSF